MTHAPLHTLIAILALTLSAFGKPTSIHLTADGKALLQIVLSPQATAATKAVASELSHYLEQISGAKFEIQTGDGSRGIVLGAVAEFPNAAFNEALAIHKTYDGREAFAIRTEKDRVLLIGATDLGASHAAFTLLEQLGCRWFFPAKEWEVVPKQPTLDVALEVTDRPRLLARRIWYGYGPFPDDKKHPLGGSCQGDYDAWARHNRMASSFRVSAGHQWQSIIASNKKVFAEHPEYLALVKGKREGEQFCVSNPAVRKMAVEAALKFFEKNPDREMVSMECSDGGGQCECDECRKLGNISDRVFGLANEVAREVAVKCPGKMVGCLAYNEHCEPPSFALEPNLYVQLTAGFIRGRYSFDELADLWPKKCRNLGFYEYFSVWLWDFDKLPGGKGSNISAIRNSVRRYAKLGATSMDAESGNNWGVHGLGYYVANKLMWNPESDVDAVLADFFDKAFGPAAAPMRRYYERWMPDKQPLISRGFMGDLFRDLGEASRLAKDRPDVLARLDQVKHYLHYNHLRWLLDHEKDKARQKDLSLEVLTFAYRTRYEYMNHWNAIQTTFAGDAAKRFDEPAWQRNNKAPKPWNTAGSVTPEETEQWFREGLDFFQPTPSYEQAFAYDDLAPVQAGGEVKPAGLNQIFQRSERYALFSRGGETLELEITPGAIAWYRDRPDARWTLQDGKGVTITQGTLPLDGEPHLLQMSVPKSGAYFFECNDSAAGWRIKSAADRSVTWLPQRGKRVIHLGYVPQLFFFVPKGTRHVQYFYSGGPHKVLGPDHKVIAEIKAEDEVVTIPVPPTMDGQCWSLAPHGHSQLWFFNVPNCLAASPQGLLVPRTVAEMK